MKCCFNFTGSRADEALGKGRLLFPLWKLLSLFFFLVTGENNRLLWAFNNPGGNSLWVTASWLTRIRLFFFEDEA